MDDGDKAERIRDVTAGARSDFAELSMMLADDLEEVMVGKIVTAIRDNGGHVLGKAMLRRLAYDTEPYCQLRHFDNALLRAKTRGLIQATRSTFDPGNPFLFILSDEATANA